MAVAILLLGFWLVSLYGLAITPPVYEDEPWQASTGWKLATEGVFGSDMFAGYYNMDQRYYDFMPLHPAALALVFRIAGPGLFQARLETVVFGLLTLCLTYALGKRLFGTTVGLLAVALLLGLRLLATGRFQETGIPLFDFARIARYDMVVPVFGLAALHAYITAMHKKRLVWYGASGLLAALAGLSHLYGVFFLVVLLVLVAWNRDGWRALGMLVAGF
ncbi:MAG: glycosyltransferase family 39 protein, partial [Anaerolineae bacterium]|nr:glycosyltransferase family 39 protein [Anaerolineae bacterium]